MLHRLLVAPLYRILPSSPTPRVLITYVPGLGHPTHLRLRLISSARFHNLLTAHLVTHPFQGLSRQRMDQMVGPQRIRTTPGRTLSVTKSNRDSVEGSRRGLHLAAYARSAGRAVNSPSFQALLPPVVLTLPARQALVDASLHRLRVVYLKGLPRREGPTPAPPGPAPDPSFTAVSPRVYIPPLHPHSVYP